MKKKLVLLQDTGQRNPTTAIVLAEKPSKGKGKHKRIDPKEHIRQYTREYQKRPHVIARRRTPEALAQKAAYDKVHVKEYQNRPEIKERRRQYRKEYNQRPEVKEHRREVRKRRRYLIKKLEK